MTFTLEYDSDEQLANKLKAIASKLGYRMEPQSPEISVGNLAKQLNRPTASLSRSLRNPLCPPFQCIRGKSKILRLTPNEELLTFLTADPRTKTP